VETPPKSEQRQKARRAVFLILFALFSPLIPLGLVLSFPWNWNVDLNVMIPLIGVTGFCAALISAFLAADAVGPPTVRKWIAGTFTFVGIFVFYLVAFFGGCALLLDNAVHQR
jgi:hypothetical protein